MTADSSPGRRQRTRSGLFEINSGEVLGTLPRGVAERGYHTYQDRRVVRIVWTGEEIEAELTVPTCAVRISVPLDEGFPPSVCTNCHIDDQPCAHSVASLLQWLDIRATMQRLGPGSMWRANSRHPFISPGRTAAQRVDLSHLTGPDLRSALELQLSLQKAGTASARLVGTEVEIRIALPSGDNRYVFFDASTLPAALPLLRSLPRIRLDGELSKLELSEVRLRPVLTTTWDDQGIVLEPGYRLATGQVFTREVLNGRIYGRWAHIGKYLCRVLDPATPLVPFHRKGRQVLRGREALRFLNLDHQQLSKHGWYLPQGQLATYRQPQLPKPIALEAESTPNGKVRVRPRFEVSGKELSWADVLVLLESGFTRIGEAIVRAPDLGQMERLGFKMPKRRRDLGLLGSRIAFIRLVAESGIPVEGPDPELRGLANVLQGRNLEELTSPPGLRSRLRPYQQAGVAWLMSRYLVGVGGLLADDMGLGKTHQVMGLLCFLHDRSPEASSLVVCPRGVLEHWHTLLDRYAPDLRVCLFHGPSRSLEGDTGGCVVLTTYDILFRSTDELADREWEVAVFDEAQRIKNPRTKAARAARKVPAVFRVALTGTPLENRLLELWSVVDLILPGYLGSEREFRSAHRSPSHHQLHRLRQRLAVLTLRRVKEQVLNDLPDKVEDLRYCHLLPAQEAIYRRIHQPRAAEIVELLRDEQAEIPYMHIFALLTRLKQVCDHPALIDPGEAGVGSAKMEIFDQILDEALDGGLQIVVFSQYVKMIDILSRHLDRRKISHLMLTGETRNRGRVVRRFNSEQHEHVLLASLLAGGVGIDLTGASVVLHYDRWWNPAKENQATDRVHRIGQRRFVQVFKLITRGTIEERVDELIRSKVELVEQVVAPTEDMMRGLDRSELAQLIGLDLEERANEERS